MTAFDELIVKVDKNETLKKVVATVLNDAGNAWGGNPPTAFMGINIKESLPDEYKNMFDSSIESFKTTTKDTVTRDLTSFSNTLKSYKNAIKYAKTLTTEGSTMEELQSDMTDFLCSLTEDSVEVIKESFTDDMLTKAGVTEENTEAVKEVVNSALDEVTKMDEEQRVQEAEALNTVIAYVTNHQTTNESEESEKTVSDEEAVDAIVGSEMISGIICDMAESDWTITSTESEKEQISAALEKYEDSEDEDEKKTVEAIKKLFGITSDEEE
jgi:hypothetical protein